MKPHVWEMLENFEYPFVRAQIPSLISVQSYFESAQENGYYSNFGPSSIAFERRVEEMYGHNGSAVACSSCTSGLSAAIIALRLEGPILIPAFTFAATFSSIRGAGLHAVIGDVDPNTGILDIDDAVRLIRKHNCRGVIVVRPYGIWTDISELVAACEAAGARVIVDNAAGFGIDGKVFHEKISPSRIEVFSLHATKPFGVGEGGLIWAPAAMEDNLRSAVNFGLWTRGNLRPGEGLNAKMDEATASLACGVMDEWPRRIRERQKFAAILSARAAEFGLETYCGDAGHIASPWQCFPVKLPSGVNVEAVVSGCARLGLQVRRYYFPILDKAVEAERARALSDRTVCLPVYDGAYSDQANDIWAIFAAALEAVQPSRVFAA